VYLNIVIINDTAHVNGGAAKLAITEARGLADRGHRVFFFAAVLPVASELEEHANITVISTNQFDLLADPSRLRAFLQGWWNQKAFRGVKAVVAPLDRSNTVVHLHIWSRALSSSVGRAVLDAGFPTICTLHDFVLACPTGTFFLHQEKKICELKPMSRACVSTNCDTRSYPQKLWRVGRQVVQQHFGHLPSHLTDYIVHSQLALDVMKPYLPGGATIHELPVYIDSPTASAARPAENETFTYVGRLVGEKGVMMLARSSAAEQLPVTFVGSGSLAGEIQAANPKAVVTGWVDRDGCVDYLRRSRALVFPSLWYETLGLVVLEAAAHGIPSIVPDSSAAREIVEDGVTGFHFQGGNESDLRSKMRQLNDPQVAASLGRAAYDRFWASPFSSLDTHISSLQDIYENVLRRTRFETNLDRSMQKSEAEDICATQSTLR
jgi:glycosyltransferase involved in cell wall biosynthesis